MNSFVSSTNAMAGGGGLKPKAVEMTQEVLPHPDFADLIKGGVQDSINSLKAGEQSMIQSVNDQGDFMNAVESMHNAEFQLTLAKNITDKFVQFVNTIYNGSV